MPAMPPRLTLREIQARRQRAEEGIAHFKPQIPHYTLEAMAHYTLEAMAREQGRVGMAQVADALEGDASWQRRSEEIRRERRRSR